MANFGYGGFLYGRGVYGQNLGQVGAISSSWSASSTAVARRSPTINMPRPAWVWESTSVAHPIDAGRIVSDWGYLDTLINAQIVANPKYKPNWVWSATRVGTLAKAGTHVSTWTAKSSIKASLRVFASVTNTAVWDNSIEGWAFQVGSIASTAVWSSSPNGKLRVAGFVASVAYSQVHIAGHYSPASGSVRADWASVDKQSAAVSYTGQFVGIPWLELSTINGHKLWESEPGAYDPNWASQDTPTVPWTAQMSTVCTWAPRTVSTGVWTPTTPTASTWTTIHR